MTIAPGRSDVTSPATGVGVLARPTHEHVWVVREALHAELGRNESWFECALCGQPHS